MLCKKCGAEMDDAQKFCDECGELAELDDEIEEVEETEDEALDTEDENGEPEIEVELEVEMDGEPAEAEKPLGLKWYKFISCFALYVTAIFNVFLGLNSKTNGDYYSELFSYYVSENIGMIFGILGNFVFLLGVATAVLAVATGILLIMKKGIGIKLNHVCVGALAVVMTLRNVMNGFVLLFTGSTDILSVIVSAVNYLIIGGMLIALNKIYFDKRREMFTF